MPKGVKLHVSKGYKSMMNFESLQMYCAKKWQDEISNQVPSARKVNEKKIGKFSKCQNVD
jgi:hypothetical protein